MPSHLCSVEMRRAGATVGELALWVSAGVAEDDLTWALRTPRGLGVDDGVGVGSCEVLVMVAVVMVGGTVGVVRKSTPLD